MPTPPAMTQTRPAATGTPTVGGKNGGEEGGGIPRTTMPWSVKLGPSWAPGPRIGAQLRPPEASFVLEGPRDGKRSSLRRGAQPLEGLEGVLDPVLLREWRAEERLHGGVEGRRAFGRHQVCRIREDGQLAGGEVAVDLDRMLVADDIVIAREHQCGRSDGFERTRLDVRLRERHSHHPPRPPPPPRRPRR